jgi:hypothetical protein
MHDAPSSVGSGGSAVWPAHEDADVMSDFGCNVPHAVSLGLHSAVGTSR